MDALCLATLGLVADVVPLQDENRILVKAGLNRLNEKAPLGLKALIDTAELKPERRIKADDIGFRLGPRINAAGRLGCARMVVEMFTTHDANRAQQIAEYLASENYRRQQIERKMLDQAKEMYDADPQRDAAAVVLASPEWHAGVVGIVAGRMVDYTGKPTVILAINEDKQLATGSGRSIPGFALHTALQACDDVLQGHGGHAMAAGVKVAPEQIARFRERFQQYAATHFPEGVAPVPSMRLDAEVPLSALTIRAVEELDWLEPYGAENPRPRFLAGGLTISDVRRMGQDESHLSFRVAQGGSSLRAVAWRMGDRFDELLSGNKQACIAYHPIINEFRGSRTVELVVDDFQPRAVAQLS
jgi:single-stranded-DNA-specific exonuclease